MAKSKYNFSKEELESTYKECGSFSLAGKKLRVSKVTFRQQYLKSQGLCMVCTKELSSNYTSYTCEVCLEKNREKDKPSTKLCECGETITRKEGQSKISWTKKKDCDECLNTKGKKSAKKTYLKFRTRNLARDRVDLRIKEYQHHYRNSEEGKLRRRISNSKRRATKVTTASETIDTHIESLLLTPNQKCPYCQEMNKLSIDHIIPLSKGGTHTEDNIELVCLPCNLRKGNKTKEEFIEFLNIIKGRLWRDQPSLTP